MKSNFRVERQSSSGESHVIERELAACVGCALLLVVGTSKAADQVIYADVMQNSWLSGGYGSTSSTTNTSPVHAGTYSIGVTTTSAWGAVSFNRSGFNSAGYDQISFWAYRSGSGTQSLSVRAFENNVQLGYYGISLPAGQWTQFTIPLSSLSAANTAVDGFAIQDDSGSTSTYYIDDVSLTQAPLGNMVLYADAMQNSWSSGGYGSTTSTSNTSPVHAGTDSIAVTTTSAWGAVTFNRSGFNSAGYDQISFWAYRSGSGTQSLSVRAFENYGQIGYYGISLPVGQWTQFTIPLSSLNAASTAVDEFAIQDDSGSTSTYYIDDVSLIAGTPPASADYVIYDDALGAGWQDWSWNQSDNFSNTTPVSGGSGNSIAVTVNQADQGLTVWHNAFAIHGFSALAFEVNGGTAGGHVLAVSGQRSDGTYTPKYNLPPLVTGTWQTVNVPLASMGLDEVSDVNQIRIWDTSATSSSATFYIDNWKLVGRTAPNSVAISVDASNVIRSVDTRVAGINVAAWDTELPSSATTSLLTNAAASVLRYPGGETGDKYHWATGLLNGSSATWAIHSAQFAQQAEAVGATPIITVNYGSGTPEEAAAWVAWANGSTSSTQALGTDSMGTNWGTVGYWASLRAAAPISPDDGLNFLRAQHSASYNWKYFELGNEVYGAWDNDLHGVSGSGLSGNAHDPYTYASSAATFISEMKAVDSSIKFGVLVTGSADGQVSADDYCGGPGCSSSNAVPSLAGGSHYGWTPVVIYTLAQAGTRPDFLAYHFYPVWPGDENDEISLGDAAQWSLWATTLRTQIANYWTGSGGSSIALVATEHNMSGQGKQSVSLVSGLTLADSYGQMLATEFSMATFWDLRNGENGSGNYSSSLYGSTMYGAEGMVSMGNPVSGVTVPPINTPYPNYYVFKQLASWRASGASAIAAQSTDPTLAVYATKQSSGALTLLVVNKSRDGTITGQFALSGFTPGSGSVAVSTYGKSENSASSGPTSSSIPAVGANFSYVFQPYSSTLLTISP